MNHVDIESTVRDIVSTILGRKLAPGEEMRRADEPTWDSLKHVELIFGIEEALGFQFTAEELAELDTVSKLVASARERVKSIA